MSTKAHTQLLACSWPAHRSSSRCPSKGGRNIPARVGWLSTRNSMQRWVPLAKVTSPASLRSKKLSTMPRNFWLTKLGKTRKPNRNEHGDRVLQVASLVGASENLRLTGAWSVMDQICPSPSQNHCWVKKNQWASERSNCDYRTMQVGTMTVIPLRLAELNRSIHANVPVVQV